MSSNNAVSLYLDPQIRDWVLFPITLVMILVGILRHYIVLLLQSPPKALPREALREQRALTRSQVLRSSAANSPIPPTYYKTISRHLSEAFEAGTYLKDGPPKEGEAPKPPPNPISDPAAMDGMMAGMKTQMVMMVPQMVIMGWINFFFQGFVLSTKITVPTHFGLQVDAAARIETPDMDVRWVSSLSWYFLNFFGLNGLYRLILGGDNSADSSRDMTASPFAAPQAPGQAQDYNKLFKAEKDNLQFSEGVYSWVGEGVEDRVLGRYGKI
ncbi:integral membrane protein DUF106-domain-containing protein [Mycena olivaceomarginata]|nr:integral membrane protein DUF106-domain-containing protein [Mycena olivaceomarginata]